MPQNLSPVQSSFVAINLNYRSFFLACFKLVRPWFVWSKCRITQLSILSSFAIEYHRNLWYRATASRQTPPYKRTLRWNIPSSCLPFGHTKWCLKFPITRRNIFSLKTHWGAQVKTHTSAQEPRLSSGSFVRAVDECSAFNKNAQKYEWKLEWIM